MSTDVLQKAARRVGISSCALQHCSYGVVTNFENSYAGSRIAHRNVQQSVAIDGNSLTPPHAFILPADPAVSDRRITRVVYGNLADPLRSC